MDLAISIVNQLYMTYIRPISGKCQTKMTNMGAKSRIVNIYKGSKRGKLVETLTAHQCKKCVDLNL
jgi:hypothetical protein